MHSTGSCTLCQGSLIFCSKRILVAVQHSAGRRTLVSRVTLTPIFISAPRTAVDRNLSKWHSESKGQIGSILVGGTANCVLVLPQSDVERQKDMLYDKGISRWRESKEINSLRSTLSGIDGSYTWIQIKKLLQEQVFPWCEKLVLGPQVK